MKTLKQRVMAIFIAIVVGMLCGVFTPAMAAPVAGGTLDPTLVPKYVTPLVIPPVMPTTGITSYSPQADYDIAVRQFKQQILPGGIWNTATGTTGLSYPPTTVWSYGSAADPMPDSTSLGGGLGVAPAGNSSFNYPAFTIENTSGTMNKVRWINELVLDPVACFHGTPNGTSCNYLRHLLPVDQTLHWANPSNADCMHGAANRTDCETLNLLPYMGPVPIITHVHGAHVNPESDGYPEAWYLANADNLPGTYATKGTRFGEYAGFGANSVAGSAFFAYENTQEAATIWYHDHSMGMTRLNVYAGPAGFWLIRGGAHGDSFIDDVSTVGTPNDGLLPRPAPVAGDGAIALNVEANAKRQSIREIPIVMQDRSFDWVDATGKVVPQGDPSAVATKLWYPTGRPDFDGYNGPYLGDPLNPNADISKIWNPEAFFNTFVVNGVTWPRLKVAPEQYRFRLLNGCNSRTLNIAMFVVTAGTDGIYGTADDVLGAEIPFFQIGGDQGFLPAVTMIQTGFMQALTPGAALPTVTTNGDPNQALLMMPAERADVIVDFAAVPGVTNGMHIRVINTAGDGPFNGSLAPADAADPLTSGQVMEFVIDTGVAAGLASTPVNQLVLPADTALGASTNTRQLSLNEMISDTTCIAVDTLAQDAYVTTVSVAPGMTEAACATAVADYNTTNGTSWGAAVAGPRQALLGTMTPDGLGGLLPTTQRWMDPVTQNPLLDSTETWEVYNATMDAHPIHVHLVRFEIVDREDLNIDGVTGAMTLAGTNSRPVLPNELGFKDTVVAYPGQVTRLKAKFDILGRYVWHCHIVEHEDNEMMLPFDVVPVLTVAEPATISVPAASGGTYTVTWDASTSAPGVTYTLEESTTSTFDAGTITPLGTGIVDTFFNISNHAYGTFYYRVMGSKTNYNDSIWTNTLTPVVVGPINVALAANGGVASASSSFSGLYPASGVINGNRSGSDYGKGGVWLDATANAYPDWVQVNFNGPQTIGEINVFTLQDNLSSPVEPFAGQTFTKYGIVNFNVQYWDGLAWQTVPGGAIVGNNLVWNQIVFSALTTDRIRVQVNSALNVGSRVVEIEAYTTNAVPPASSAVTLSAPIDGTVYPIAPASITLTADVVEYGGWTTDHVDFYEGANLVGTANSPAPYTISWTNVPAGTYTLTAKAVDGSNVNSGPSAPISVTVGALPVNVAAAGTVVASSTFSGLYPASGVINGNRNGSDYGKGGVWNDGTLSTYPDTIEITFNGAQTINEIDVYTLQDNFTNPVTPFAGQTFTKYGIVNFDVLYWDGAAWQTIANVVNNNLVWNKFTFPSVSTTKIMVQVNSALNLVSRIVEIEAYTP